MNPIRVGVMGCASIAQRYILPTLHAMPEYRIAAIASRDKARAEALTSRFGGVPLQDYQRLVELDDIDAVYVPLPIGLHNEWVGKLLDAGRHVMVEKSMTVNLQEARSLVTAARDRQLVLMEHFQFLHHWQTEFVHELLAAETIGSVRLLRSSFGFPPLEPGNIRYNAALGGGALLDAGVYPLRAAQLYLGEDIRVVAAEMSGNGTVDIQGSAMLVSPAGQTAQVSWGFDLFYQCSVELWGREGRICQDRAFTAPPGFGATVTVHTPGLKQEHVLAPDNHFANIWKAFHQQINQGTVDATGSAMLAQARLIDEVRDASGWSAP